MNDGSLCLMCKHHYVKHLRNGYKSDYCKIHGLIFGILENGCTEHFLGVPPKQSKYPPKTGRGRKPAGGYRMVRQETSLCEMCANLEGNTCRATGEVNPGDCVENFVYDGNKQKKNTHTA